ncbi:hypothetical protein CFOL_v3_22250 [Cephalotus follicularis]|uniref:Cyclin_C domain-containing protein n=1 Tax=Cephalotus follicularis TaxID=3775 RepID=A0A1Q3CF00_CEPFO|nr:hypothetical protein CFOL_v3_22250 [Cephalotus follicularis]
MDLILMHPPYLIALACLYIATVCRENDAIASFEELQVDMNVVKNISMEILDFYKNHRLITDERINMSFNKLVFKP